MIKGFIYKITNDINDKVYIGKTTLSSVEDRFQEHLKDSQRARFEKRPLYNAISKYGIENFHIYLIEEVPLEQLEDREKYWIKQYNSYQNGYNATLGGDGKLQFDYEAIVKEYQKGLLIKEIAKKFNCSNDTVARAISLAKMDTSLNYNKTLQKSIIMKKENKIINIFPSRKEASLWLQKNNYTKSMDLDNIIAAIGRVANGQRKSAYGFSWENI